MGISDRFARRTNSALRTGAGVGRGRLLGAGIAVAAAGALVAAGLAGAGSALAAGKPGTAAPAVAAGGYQFVELGSHSDRTFNQLLGINNNGRIAGYFGSGVKGHPNKGYTITAPYAQGDIKGENFPHSVQTQVTGLNDDGVQVGFYSTQNTASGVNNNFGWYFNGSFHEVVFPTGNNDKPTTDQLLGVNDHDVAVGFYTNGQGSNRGYAYDIRTHQFTRVLVPGYPTGTAGPSLTAAAIDNRGDIAGFYTDARGTTDAFLDYRHGPFRTLDVPGASSTEALGVNDHDEVVGVYTVGTGASAAMHGFTWTPRGGFASVDDPQGVGTTTINGVNDAGDLVGFFVDATGNTDGFRAAPHRG